MSGWAPQPRPVVSVGSEQENASFTRVEGGTQQLMRTLTLSLGSNDPCMPPVFLATSEHDSTLEAVSAACGQSPPAHTADVIPASTGMNDSSSERTIIIDAVSSSPFGARPSQESGRRATCQCGKCHICLGQLPNVHSVKGRGLVESHSAGSSQSDGNDLQEHRSPLKRARITKNPHGIKSAGRVSGSTTCLVQSTARWLPPKNAPRGRAQCLWDRKPARRRGDQTGRGIQVGSAFQARIPQQLCRLNCEHAYPHPTCDCGLPSVYRRGRFWCPASCSTSGQRSCGFEWAPSGEGYQINCACGRLATWFRNRFVCARVPPHHSCTLEYFVHTPTPRETRVDTAQVEKDRIRPMLTMLTASAYGLVLPWCFVAPCACGLGLFARVQLEPGQVICEYGGPRLPQALAEKGDYVLEVNSEVVIDGKSENSPFPCKEYPAIYANHSGEWANAELRSCDLNVKNARHSLTPTRRLVLIARCPVKAGEELRFDYERGNTKYWKNGKQPLEARGEWRHALIATPLPTPSEPVFLPQREDLSQCQQQSLYEVLEELAPKEALIPWEGSRGGDYRLRKLMADYFAEKEYQNMWSLICTHLPGRTGAECRDRWQKLCATEREHIKKGLERGKLLESSRHASDLDSTTALSTDIDTGEPLAQIAATSWPTMRPSELNVIDLTSG